MYISIQNKKICVFGRGPRLKFAKKIFYYYMRKINTNVRDVAQDTLFFDNFFDPRPLANWRIINTNPILNSPTIILIILFTLLRSNSGFSLTADFIRLIWYSLSLVEYIPSEVYMIKCHSVPVITIP